MVSTITIIGDKGCPELSGGHLLLMSSQLVNPMVRGHSLVTRLSEAAAERALHPHFEDRDSS